MIALARSVKFSPLRRLPLDDEVLKAIWQSKNIDGQKSLVNGLDYTWSR